LKGWGANLRGADIKKKKDISNELKELEELEETVPLSPSQRARRSLLQQELLTVLDNEESFWRQRSRENWLLHGDSNSAFFHRAANGCKRKRTIFSLKKVIQLFKVMLLCWSMLLPFTKICLVQ
jgi:hypothetical protein